VTVQREGDVFWSAVHLTVAIAVGWIIAFWPARLMGGQVGVYWMSAAAAICLVPGWIVLGLSKLAVLTDDLSALLVQSMVRLGSVATAALVVRRLRPELSISEFFGWLIGFYLLALFMEVRLLRRNSPDRLKSANNINDE